MSDERYARTTGTTQCGSATMRWVESGPEDAARVLLLHGIYAGAHAYEWRRLTPLLEPRYRVRVPDLLGAGASDRPDVRFDAALVARAVAALIDDAGPDTHVVASSLTGAYAVGAIAEARRSASLTLVTPSGLTPRRHVPGLGAFGTLTFEMTERTPLGPLLVRGLTSAPSVSWFQRHRTYRDPTVLTEDEIVETQRAGRAPGAQHLQLAFVFGRLICDVDPACVGEISPTVVWGCGQRFVPHADATRWRDAGARVIEVGSGLPHVEEPERFAEILADVTARS